MSTLRRLASRAHKATVAVHDVGYILRDWACGEHRKCEMLELFSDEGPLSKEGSEVEDVDIAFFVTLSRLTDVGNLGAESFTCQFASVRLADYIIFTKINKK